MTVAPLVNRVATLTPVNLCDRNISNPIFFTFVYQILVWKRIILLPMFFLKSRLPLPLSHIHTYIHCTHLSLYYSPSSEVGFVIPPIQPIHPIEYICRDKPHPARCFDNVNNQLYTSLSVSLLLASDYTLYLFVPSFETISICFYVKWSQDEYTMHNLREISRSASTKRGIILKEGNQNENRKPVPWDRDPATLNSLIINQSSH